MGLAGRVVLLCDLNPSGVAHILRGSVLAVQASLAEPFGLAVIEAAACGTPVVVSAVGGHLEIVEDGRTGWVFQPGDVQSCTDAIRRALADPAEASQRAQTLALEVRARFTWQRCALQYQLLLSAISRSCSPSQ